MVVLVSSNPVSELIKIGIRVDVPFVRMKMVSKMNFGAENSVGAALPCTDSHDAKAETEGNVASNHFLSGMS